MKIKLTEFALRHFDRKFGGTKILNVTPEDFQKYLDTIDLRNDEGFHCWLDGEDVELINGYASFCMLLPIKNFTDASVGSMPITLENYQYLRSGYSARRESELPVFSRWLELPLEKPKADYLMLVLYDKAQLDKEASVDYDKRADSGLMRFGEQFIEFDADFGVVAILGQSQPGEEPMKPETMLRNALGVEEGGSGVALDREKYLKSVDFWSKNATVS